MTLLPTLPLEVQRLVIGFVGGDKFTLRNASATCNVWRVECYRHLFSSIELNHSSIGSLSSLLSNRFTAMAIPPCVSRLHVNLHRHELGVDRGHLDRFDHVLTCLCRTGRVQVLVVTNISLKDAKLYDSLSSSFPGIRSLYVTDSSFPTLAQLTGFISSYGQVRRVQLRGIDCPLPTLLLPFEPPPGMYVLQISSVGSMLRTGMQWCSQDLPEQPMQLRDLAITSLLHMGNINVILQSLASSLHSLEFIYPFQNDAHQTSPYHIDLCPATCLHYLSLGFPDRVLGVMPWILCILHSLSGSSLKGLHIYFSASRQFTLDLPFLRFLERTLRGYQFRHLESIHFLAFYSLGDEEVQRLVVRHTRECLLGWHQEGKLKFSFID